MPAYLCHAIVMAVHAVYTLACLGKDKLVYPSFADFAFEAMGMI
jgi:hypothetical protein